MADPTDAATSVVATENLRPYCQQRTACRAKSARHCNACSAASPETRARRIAAQRAVYANPVYRAAQAARCRALAADPEMRARKGAMARSRYADPEERKKLGEACRAGWSKALEDSQFREQRRQLGMVLTTPENRRKMGAASSESRLRWCPKEYRADNQRLARAGFKLEQRKEMIAEMVRADARREVEENARRMREKHARELAQAY